MDGPELRTARRRLEDVGGTSGGLGEFLLGLGLLGVGAWLFLSRVVVMSGLGSLFGPSSFGLVLLPIAAGVAWLFFDGSSKVGWLLLLGGLTAIIVGLVMDLRLYFQPTSLPLTIGMLAAMFGGVGLVFRALRSHGD